MLKAAVRVLLVAGCWASGARAWQVWGPTVWSAPGVRMSMLLGAPALEFCRSKETAVIATLWPTANSQVGAARQWLADSGATIVHEQSVYVRPEAAVPAMLALYHGEEWLESNCWSPACQMMDSPTHACVGVARTHCCRLRPQQRL